MNLVPPEKLADVIPLVTEWIARAVDRNQGDENLWDVIIAIAQGRYHLWYEPGKFAAVVQVQKFPRQSVAAILYLGGSDLEAMQALWDQAKAWCRQNGISVLRTYGREGWTRVLDLKPTGSILQVQV